MNTASDKNHLHYEQRGAGEWIIFIHGNGQDHRVWNNQVNYFAKKFKTLAVDMRGFGKSPVPSGEYSHAGDLNTVLTDLKIEVAHLVGLSLGGEIAIDYAITYPQSIASLTLINSSVSGYESTVSWEVYAKEQGLDEARSNWLKHPVFDSSRSNSQALNLLTTMISTYSGWHWQNQDPRRKLNPPAIERLNEIKAPTHIVSGKLDLPYFRKIAHMLAQGIPLSKLTEVEGVGHMFNLEKPSTFNAFVEEFIQKAERQK